MPRLTSAALEPVPPASSNVPIALLPPSPDSGFHLDQSGSFTGTVSSLSVPPSSPGASLNSPLPPASQETQQQLIILLKLLLPKAKTDYPISNLVTLLDSVSSLLTWDDLRSLKFELKYPSPSKWRGIYTSSDLEKAYQGNLREAIRDLLHAYMNVKHKRGRSGGEGSHRILAEAIAAVLGEAKTRELVDNLKERARSKQ